MKALRHLLHIVLAAFLLTGCELDFQGENGTIQFADMTERPGQLFANNARGPVAANSVFRVRISSLGGSGCTTPYTLSIVHGDWWGLPLD